MFVRFVRAVPQCTLFRRRAASGGAATAVMEQQRGRHEKNHPGGHGGIGRRRLRAAARRAPTKPLTLGVSVGLGNVAMEIAVREARAQGWTSSWWSFPTTSASQNEGVNDGSLDANYYQHLPYLESMIAAKGYKLVPVALGYTSRMAIYSRSTALAELPDGAAIAYPNDPVNTGHALLILQEAGLITLCRTWAPRPRCARHGNRASCAFASWKAASCARWTTRTRPSSIRASSRWPASSRNRRSTPKRQLALCHPLGHAAGNAQDPRLLKFIAIYQGSEEVRATLRACTTT